MRDQTPTIYCDYDDGLCGTWDLDWYAVNAQPVDGPMITAERPAPGWVVVDGEDFCPEHNPDQIGGGGTGVKGGTR